MDSVWEKWEEWNKHSKHDIEISNKASELVLKYEKTFLEEDRKIAQDFIDKNGHLINTYYLSIMSALLKTKKGENMLDHLFYINGGKLGEFNFEIPKDGK